MNTKKFMIENDGPHYARLLFIGYQTEHGLTYNASGTRTVRSIRGQVSMSRFVTGDQSGAEKLFEESVYTV